MISADKLVIRNLLQQNVLKLNEVILPGFRFNEIKKDDKPYDFLISLVLNKLYSFNVTLENNLLCNDVHQSVAAYRYMYELYIKMLSIFSEESGSSRLDEFYSNKKKTIREWLSEIRGELLPSNFSERHKEHYESINKFVHPNIESLSMHRGKSDDQIFDFIVPNTKLAVWLQVNLLCLFAQKASIDSFKTLNVHELKQILSRIDDRS